MYIKVRNMKQTLESKLSNLNIMPEDERLLRLKHYREGSLFEIERARITFNEYLAKKGTLYSELVDNMVKKEQAEFEKDYFNCFEGYLRHTETTYKSFDLLGSIATIPYIRYRANMDKDD